MKIFGRKVGIANTSKRRKRVIAVAIETVPETEYAPPLSPPTQLRKQLSPLSTLVSKFIADNARTTHDSIEDEKEQRDFVTDLCETLESVRDGKERPPSKSLTPRASNTSQVIDFFAETTKSTLDSIQDKDERIEFEEHLTKALRQSFEQETILMTTR
jgi:hypothetical protein